MHECEASRKDYGVSKLHLDLLVIIFEERVVCLVCTEEEAGVQLVLLMEDSICLYILSLFTLPDKARIASLKAVMAERQVLSSPTCCP